MDLVTMKRKSVPLHAEVAEILRHRIVSGDLPAGTQLPPLNELTKTLGVARMTVRQAMTTLEDDGLIQRFRGKGTFVRDVALTKRKSLKMKAELSELHSMVRQLKVSVVDGQRTETSTDADGTTYVSMRRIHTLDGVAFCYVDLRLEKSIYDCAPERFAAEIVISVLNSLKLPVISARQRVTISYADFEIARALSINVNTPVFRVFREFFTTDGRLVYSAKLTYPGDLLEFDVEFTVDEA